MQTLDFSKSEKWSATSSCACAATVIADSISASFRTSGGFKETTVGQSLILGIFFVAAASMCFALPYKKINIYFPEKKCIPEKIVALHCKESINSKILFKLYT